MDFYQPKVSTKIGLTPLIDVVFILLLFFMLASSFSRWQQLPVTSVVTGGGASTKTKTINVQLFSDSSLQVEGGQRIVLDDWGWLETLLETDGDAAFRITPVGSVSVQTLINTVDNMQQRGVSSLAFGAQP